MTTDATRPRQQFSGDGWSLDVHETADLSVYALRGEFDFAVSPKLAELLPPDPGAGRVVLDMSEVEFCDSSCLQAMLRLARRCTRPAAGSPWSRPCPPWSGRSTCSASATSCRCTRASTRRAPSWGAET